MFLSTLDYLTCSDPGSDSDAAGPCGGRLTLRVDHVTRADGHPEGKDIAAGLLRCENCGATYPILAGIAVLLPEWPSYIRERVPFITGITAEALPEEVTALLAGHTPETPPEVPGSSWESDDVVNAYLLNHYLCYSLDALDDLNALFTSPRIAEMLRRDWPQTPPFVLKSWLSEGTAPGSILELGCSVGGTLALLAAERAGLYLGLDMSIRAIAVARRLLSGTDAGCGGLLPARFEYSAEDWLADATRAALRRAPFDFIVGDAWQPPVAQDAWDVVATFNMIDFAAVPEGFVAAQAALTRRGGGRCFSAAPLSAHSPAAAALIAAGRALATDPATVTDALATLYRQAGLDLVRRCDDLPWIIPRGPRYFEFFSVDVMMMTRKGG